MAIEIGLTNEGFNTRYAPLAVLLAHYQSKHCLQRLENVQLAVKTYDFSPGDKLQQVLISILAGCETLSETSTKLKPEVYLAKALGWERFSDQSNLSRTLDALTQKQIEELRQNTTVIWKEHSQIRNHDWHGYLYLDYDLSGLPCSPRVAESQKGYFSDKKTVQAGSWLV